MKEKVYLLFDAFFFSYFPFFALQRSEKKETLHCGNKCFGFLSFLLRVCILYKLFTYLSCFEIMANWTKPLDMRKL